MSRPRVTLYDFVPYGAPELLEFQQPHLTRALTVASAGLVVLFVIAMGVSSYLARHPGEIGVQFRPRVDLMPPPRLDVPLLPRLDTPPNVTPPAAGRLEPVPDAQAAPELLIPSQDELRRANPGSEGAESGDGVTPAPPVDEAPPLRDVYQYYDVAPVLVSAPKPAYPDLAWQAGVDGTVMLRVLVGKDGGVKDVHVDRSIPLLDEAAVAAARTWVFTPALSGDHPVMVWVAVPVRFTLH